MKNPWVIFSCGLLLGALLFEVLEITASNVKCPNDFEYIRKDSYCDLSDKKAQKFDYLESEVSDMVQKFEKEGEITRSSVFVRDLKTTRFMTVNESEEYIMASLLKVPLAIAAYKLAEVEPDVLNQTLTYEQKDNLYDQQYYKVTNQLQLGNNYSIKELINRSIIYSDNSAAQTLSNYFANGFFAKILDGLGLSSQINKDGELIVTARTYANIFRILYNSSYISREYSNEVLKTLTQTQFISGATSKIPLSVKVAHKFAERTLDNGLKQLHECGIVYLRNGSDPYSFCIMTEGKEFKDLEKVQSDISYTIFKSLSGHR